MAVPCANTSKAPRVNNVMRIGSNQNFLRTFMKPHRSLIKSVIIILRVKKVVPFDLPALDLHETA